MRSRILTETEKKAIKTFKRNREKTILISVTVHRAKRYLATLQDDIATLKDLIINYEKSKRTH